VTHPLLQEDAAAEIKRRVAALEAATGAEVVTAVVARADSYPEIPWRAFALGASLASLVSVAAALMNPGWGAIGAAAETAVAALATGGAAALVTVWIEPFARLFLPRARRRAEVLQYAQATFLEAQLQATKRRDGILLLVSLFEHEVVVLADRGVSSATGPETLQPVVAAITAQLARGNLKDALLDGLARLEATLLAGGVRAQPGEVNELPDEVVQRGVPR